MNFHSNIYCDFSDRAYEVWCAHCSAPMVSMGGFGLNIDMYKAFMEGGWSMAMIHKNGRIYIRYVPRELTQFMFDAYAD